MALHSLNVEIELNRSATEAVRAPVLACPRPIQVCRPNTAC